MSAPAHVKVPVVCFGQLLQQDDDDIQANVWPVHLFSTPNGEINTIWASLNFMPGNYSSFQKGMFVSVLVYHMWEVSSGRFLEAIPGDNNLILGLYKGADVTPFRLKNPTASVDGANNEVYNEVSGAAIQTMNDGSVRLVTNGMVSDEMSPYGSGQLENAKRNYAQNYHRVLSGQYPLSIVREHFGMFAGTDSTDKATKTSPSDFPILYRRFVTETLDVDSWVSTNEGMYCPWVGVNNLATSIKTKSGNIYSKVINKKDNRISITAGKTGPGFYTFRVDKIMTPESQVYDQPIATPPVSSTVFYLGISEEGEVKLEAGISAAKQPAMTLTVKKDGSVNIDVGKSFTINGKKIVTENFVSMISKNQAAFVVPMAPNLSPAVSAELIKGVLPGQFFADVVANTKVSSSPMLTST